LVTAFLAAIGFSSTVWAGPPNPLATPPKGRAFAPSRVVFPDQQVPLRFVHDVHVKQDIDCATCHENAENSLVSTDLLVPVGFEGEELCSNCHSVEDGVKGDPPSGCVTCHSKNYKPVFPTGADPNDTTKAKNRPAMVRIPTPNLKMNHKIHLEKGIDCAACHSDMTQIQVGTRENALPTMGTCMACRDGKKAPSECRTCHLVRPDGRMVTHFRQGVLKPSGRYRDDAHNDHFLKTHAMSARGDEAYCANCHRESFCLDCHNGVSRPLTIHPNNWLLTHPISARRNDPDCRSCHRTQSFCMDCHKRMSVVPVAEFKTGGSKQGFNVSRFGKFHPAGWVSGVNGEGAKDGIPRGPNHHAFQAQRNMRACSACHSERTCTQCHATKNFGSLGINPHPPAFGGTAKCSSLSRTNLRMCMKCHVQVPECR